MLGKQPMTPERKLQRVKISLLRNPKVALMSGILMVGKTSIADNVPTACTNGRDEIYGVEFVNRLPEKQLAFVVMHEAGHKMYRHLTTWSKLHDEDPLLANAACDYVINLMLRDLDPTETFMSFPMDEEGKPMGLIDEKYRGMNAKQVFDALKQEMQEQDGEGGDGEPCDGEGRGRGGGKPGMDDHD